jgi:hypothetical protein
MQPPVAILLDDGIVVLRLVAGEVRLGLGDLRLMLGELGARLLERGLEGARVDREEEVAGRDVLPLLEVDLGDLAADLGEHGHRRRRLHVADGPHPDGDVARGHLRHNDGHAGDTPFGLGPRSFGALRARRERCPCERRHPEEKPGRHGPAGSSASIHQCLMGPAARLARTGAGNPCAACGTPGRSRRVQ